MNSNLKVLSFPGDVIISGYLLKSRRTELLRKLLWNLDCVKHSSEFNVRHWKRRYCILYKVRRQNTTEIFFDYYKDESFSKFKGRVDLEHCECIVENANIGGQPCAFSLTTLFNGHKRIYYFVAANNKIMSDWVHHLARVAELVDFSTTSTEVNPTESVGNNVGLSVPPLFQRPTKTSVDNSGSHPINSSSVDGNKSPINQINSQQCQPFNDDDGEDDYKDVVGGVDYLMSGSELLDDYHHLPTSSHSYVNLPNDAELDKGFNPNYSSLPARKDIRDISMKQSNDAYNEIYINNDVSTNTNNNSNKQKDQVDLNPTANNSQKNSLQRQNSSNSVYYNVWESEDGSKVEVDSGIKPKPNVQMASNTRVYRRSHVSSAYLQPNSSVPSSFGQKAGLCVPIATTSTATDGKPIPPPRMGEVKQFSSTLPPSFTNSTNNVLSELSPELPLPVRAKRSQISLDSSLNSSSSSIISSSNSSIRDDNNSRSNINMDNGVSDKNNCSLKEENKENRIHSSSPFRDTGKLSADHRSTVTTCSVTTNTVAITTTIASGKLQSNLNPGVTKSGHSVDNKIFHLNYIEPSNLDLRTVESSNERVYGGGLSSLSTQAATVVLTTTVTTTTTTTTTTAMHSVKKSDIFSNNLTSSTMPNLIAVSTFSNSIEQQSASTNRLLHIGSSSLSTSSATGCLPTASQSVSGLLSPINNHTVTTTMINTTANVEKKDDYIEYREIDPISTNALAIVAERFG
ncbi:unnamed protein product [Heterobilharzia americana]|nr:unnamed protein product [Heterobilharzia americana]